jgi:Ca-activated chloride channel family protein
MSLAMAFQHPEYLGPVSAVWLAVAGAVAASAWLARRRARRLGTPRAPARAGLARDAALLVALLALGLALLGPRIGTRTQRLAAAGVDVVVLVDVSRSMDARDLPPSRLDRARQTAARLLAGLEPGDRAALAAFAERGVVLTPLTHDRAALADLLPALDTTLVRPASSRLGAGVRAALAAFDAGSERPRVLVVLSDGEDADGSSDLGLVQARRAGARVVAVALGSEAGAPIESLGLMVRDGSGRIVTTRVDAKRLGRLAEASDGALLRPDAFGAVDAAALRAAVRRDAPEPGAEEGTVERRVPAVRAVPFALAALALLALEAGAGGAGRRRRPAGRAAALLASALLAAVAGVPARGSDDAAARGSDDAPGRGRTFDPRAAFAPLPEATEPREPDPRALLRRGLALAERERWADAERAFRAAALMARDPALGADAYHDAGVAALREGRFEAARDAFFEALALAPEGDAHAEARRRTRFNLEWTLRALAAVEPPPPARAEPAGDSDEETTRPEPAPDEPPITPPRPEPDSRRAAPRPAPPELGPDEAERWLARAGDDPGRALRGLRDGGPPPARAAAW